MRRLLPVLVALSSCLATMARAEVLDSAPGGFTVAHEAILSVPRAEAWRAAVADVGRWWNPDHTMRGDAAGLSIDPVPLGCFCESLADKGGVAHMTVTFVNSGVMLRLTGGLGPLGLMGVNGNMTWEFFDADGGTRVRFQYAVGGYSPGGLESIAGPVDGVIGDALARLEAYAGTGNADNGG